MNYIKLPPMLCEIFERVCLVEFKRIMRLGLDVHADHIKARAVIDHPCTARTAKQIKQSHSGFLVQ